MARKDWGSPKTTQSTALHVTTCRVCGVRIEVGDPILVRSWEVRYAHVACGWETSDPKPEVHEPRPAWMDEEKIDTP